jgi:hypothetical protein
MTRERLDPDTGITRLKQAGQYNSRGTAREQLIFQRVGQQQIAMLSYRTLLHYLVGLIARPTRGEGA